MITVKPELSFRATALFVAIFLVALALLFLSDRVPGLAELFNAHSAIGGASILLLIVLGVSCFLGLVFVLPWAVTVFCRHPRARTVPSTILLLTGALSLILIGGWLVQVARH
jgi:hypothetical protein